MDAAWHYLTHGGFEGRDPSSSFGSRWYLDTYEDVRAAGMNPLVHYLKRGQKEGRGATALAFGFNNNQESANLQLIRTSGFFDEDRYLEENPDVSQAGIDPLLHYLLYGGFEGRDLPPYFFSQWYLDTYEDVKESEVNPLVHYLKLGRNEGREATPPVLELRRMYDYSKQANGIVFEDSPEQVYLQSPKVIGSFSGILLEGVAMCPRPYISVVEDAVIFWGESLVIVENKIVLSDEMVDFPGREFGKKTSRIKMVHEGGVMFRENKKPSMYVKEGVCLSCGHDSNYFHWLVECLPKLLLLDSLDLFQDVPLLIPAGLHPNLMAALERLNTHNRPIIYIEQGAACQVDRLIYPSELSRILDRYEGSPVFNQDIVLSHKWLTKVSDQLKNQVSYDGKPWRKLFLSRRKGLRVLGNHEQVEQLLGNQGFEIVEVDGLSLDFQIKLFSEASLVVAPTGAALTNMLFCQPGTKVIIFMSRHEVTNFYFWSNLGAINNLDVTIISGERLFNLTNYYSVHDDYVVDAQLILEELRKIEYNTMKVMCRFFLMTRGRTGSTAVIDELNMSNSLRVAQELFLIYNFNHMPNFESLYDFILPFDEWKIEKRESSSIEKDIFTWATDYLEEAESVARQQGMVGFGLKVLSHHFKERSFLSTLLKQRGYKAVYLTRNLSRQVISGIIAVERGIYNTKDKIEDSHRYHIDLDKFQEMVLWEAQSVEEDLAQLKSKGFEFIVVSYENFREERRSFYNRIFQFLGLPTELPPSSEYSITIKDLRNTIENYDEVAERAAAIGVPIDPENRDLE